mgnify:CR=1 FL=1
MGLIKCRVGLGQGSFFCGHGNDILFAGSCYIISTGHGENIVVIKTADDTNIELPRLIDFQNREDRIEITLNSSSQFSSAKIIEITDEKNTAFQVSLNGWPILDVDQGNSLKFEDIKLVMVQ